MITVSHPHLSQYVRTLLTSLEQRGALQEFHTTLSFGCRAIDVPGIRSRTRQFPCREIARLLAVRLRQHWLTSHDSGLLCTDAIVQEFDRHVDSDDVACSLAIRIAAGILDQCCGWRRTRWANARFQQVNAERFSAGGGVEHGIVQRYFGELGESIDTAAVTPLLGHGLGIGTNAGAAILTGSRSFLLGEGEWSRVVGESGPIIGYAYILLRLAIAAYLILQGWKAMGQGDGTPLLLVAAALVDIVSGQFGQPSIMGFAVFISGLALACCNRASKESVSLSSFETRLPREVPAGGSLGLPERRIRGRSPIAEAITDTPEQRIGPQADFDFEKGGPRDARRERE